MNGRFFDTWFARHQQLCGVVSCLDVSVKSISEAETEIEICCPSCGDSIIGSGNRALSDILFLLKRSAENWNITRSYGLRS